MSKRFFIHGRVSSKGQLDGNSIEDQLQQCRDFVTRLGGHVVGTYIERARSGWRKLEKRAEFHQMIGDALRGGCDAIAMFKLDRFARNTIFTLQTHQQLLSQKIEFYSVCEQMNFATPEGKYMLTNFAGNAQYYSDNLSRLTIQAKAGRANRGYWNGDLPFGYFAQDRFTAVPNPATADGARLAFTEYNTGTYYDMQIAELLNDHGYRTQPKGRRASVPFSKDTVRSMLANPFYAGWVSYKGVLHPGKHPALVSQATFDNCQRIRAQRRGQPKRANPKTRVYPLAHLAYCASCGRALRGQYQGGHRYYRDPARDYDCHCDSAPLVRADALEESVAQFIIHTPLPESSAQAIEAELKRTAPPVNTPERRARLESKLKRLRDAWIEGLIERQEYDQRTAQVQSSLSALTPTPATQPNYAEAARLVSNLGTAWAIASEAGKQKLLQAMLERVFVRQRRLEAIQPTEELYRLMQICWLRTRRASSSEPTNEFEHFSADGIVIFPPSVSVLAAVAILETA